MHIKSPKYFTEKLSKIAETEGEHSEMMMNFSILTIGKNDTYINNSELERVYLLMNGSIEFIWDTQRYLVSRKDCFDENPWVLHLSKGVNIKITGFSEKSEVAIIETKSDTNFPSKIYSPDNVRHEFRGRGTLKETSTRIVRTVFDKQNAPYSNLVVGEVIDMPGKWSSYPPHHHPQPEIYFYKFKPDGGFGYCELGENVVKVRHNSTTFIKEGMTHPQVTAPGYAMWYLWVIRHLEDKPYIEPVFSPEHLWTIKDDAPIWSHKEVDFY